MGGVGEVAWQHRRGGQRGSGSMLVVSMSIALMAVGLVMAWQGSWVASHARARSVADLVALSAARAQLAGAPACATAERSASDNHAELSECQVTTGWGEFIVDVTVEVSLTPQVAGGPRAVQADSRAGVLVDDQ